MTRNRTPRFMTLFSPARRSARTNRWRKRFQNFSLSSWQSSRVVESVCSMFRVGAEATRLVRGSVTSQIVMAGGGRSLRMEGLEQRALLAADVYVDDDWASLSNGDVIADVDGDAGNGLQPAMFGTDAFATIQQGISAVDPGGDVNVFAGTYPEALTINKSLDLLGVGSVTLDSGSLSTPISVDGGASVVVDGFTVQGGIFGVDVDAASVTIRNSVVSGGSAVGILVDGNGAVTVENSNLAGPGAGTGVAVVDGDATITGSVLDGRVDGVIVGANGGATLFGNDLSATFSGKAIQANPLAGVINAGGNFWGTTNDALIGGKVLGTIDYSVYLEDGLPAQPAVGFAGDFSHVHVTSLGAHAGPAGRIREGVQVVDAAGAVTVHDGVYDETVLVDKTVTLESLNAHGATIAPTTGSQQTVVSVNATNVTIDGFAIQVNQDDDGAIAGTNPIAPVGIGAVGTLMDGLVLSDNQITSIGSNPTVNWTGSPGLTVRAAGIVLNDAPSGGIPSVTLTNNNVSILSGTGFHQRAVWLSQLNADVTGNTFAGVANDLIFQFASGGASLIQNNTFNGVHHAGGGGVVVGDPNDASPINIVGNFFTPANTAIPSMSLQVNRNVNGATSPITIQNNQFTGYTVAGVDIGGAGGVSVSGNTFTPKAGSTGFVSVVVDSQNASNNASAASPVDVLIFGNTFNVNSGTGTAILAEDNLVGATYAANGVQIGVGGANIYNGAHTVGVNVLGGVATVTDNITGATTGLRVAGGATTLAGSTLTSNATGVNVAGTGNLTIGAGNAISGGTTGILFDGSNVGLTGLSLGDTAISASGDYITLANSAFDNLDLDATGATLDGVAVAAMTAAQKFAATGKITDELDDNSLGLVLLATNTIYVTPATSPTATDNDYTRIKNAIEAAGDNWTIDLLGAFDWTEANAAASWALGNDGVSGNDDDYSITVAGGLEGVTLTASSGLGSAIIQGPGDVATVNLESFLVFSGGPNAADDNKDWTISNLEIRDFDLSIGMFNSGAGVDAFSGLTIANNRILIATDLNATVAPVDVNQNIGIHYSFGVDQTIQGNFIDVRGDGVSDSANSRFATSVAMQSNTSGGAVYDGLLIDGNVITVLNAQSADPENILGIWENGHAHLSDVTVSNNTFTNAAVGNNPAANLQRAFRVTSHSSGTSTVTYSNNTVSGANLGFQWIAGSNFTGNQAVQVTGNTLTNVNTGFLIQSNGVANISGGNSIVNSGAMAGVGVGIDVASGSASVTGNEIQGLGIGVRFQGGAGGSVAGNDFDDAVDNATDLSIATGAGAVTIGAGNAFAGDTFFIDNQSAQSYDLSANGTTFDEANNYRIEDRMYHRVDALTSGLITWAANNVYVTTPGLGSTDSSIQRGIDAAAAGNTVNVEGGTYDEALVIGKALTLRGAVDGGGVPTTVLRPLAAVGNLIEIVSSTTGAVAIKDFELDGNNAGVRADYGIRIHSGTTFASLALDNLRVKEFRNIGLSVDGDATGQSVDAVTLSNSVFTDNGDSGVGGTGAISLFSFNENASLTNVDVTNSVVSGARSGIQFRGAGSAPYSDAGTIALNDVDVSGVYQTQMIGIQRYSTTAGVSFLNVALGGVSSAITGGFGASLRFDAVGGGTLASPATLSLGNTTFRGLAPTSAQPHEIEIAPDNAFAFLRLDGTNTIWSFGGSPEAAGSLTLSQAFAVEDRILHYVDKLHPLHGGTFGAYKGFVDVQAGQAFVTDDSTSLNTLVGDGSIQRAVDVVAAGGTVNVESGTFVENVTINKNVTLLSEIGRASTTIQGISGVGALGTIVITDAMGSTTDVNIGGAADRGFKIVGIDNGVPGIENAAVYFQGSHSGTEIRSNDVVANGDAGLMTEFGRTITNFVIDNNIFSGQTFVGTPADNGFGNQFTTPNVPRQLVVMGSGAGSADMSGLQFTNNQITGTAGGVNGGGEQGNSLVTVDGLSTTITGNTFTGSTTRFGSSLRARGLNNTISGNQFTSTGMGASTVDLYVNRTGNVITGNAFASSAGAAIQVDSLGDATIGGAGAAANSIANYAVGILVSGATAGAVVNANTITGSDVGVDVNGGKALVQGANLNGNTIGVQIRNNGVADLGQNGSGTPFTGLGVSTGGNNFSGYVATATATAGAIVNANVDAVTGRQGAPPDVTAFGNTWAVNTPAGIEDVVYHDSDASARGFVDFAAFAFTGAVTVSSTIINEGDGVTLSGSFSNVPQAHTVTIDWGDGSAPTVIDLAAGVFDFTNVPHTYEDDADGPPLSSTFPVTVTITDASNASIADNTNSVTVNNVTPTVAISGGTLAGDGQTLNFTFTTTDPGESPTDVFALQGIAFSTLSGSATGTVVPGSVIFNPSTGAGSFSVLFSAPPGSGMVEISVSVADDDLAVGSDTHVVTVGNTLRVTNFVQNDSGFDVTFNRALDLSVLNLYDGVNPLVIGDVLKAADIVVHAAIANVDVKGSVVWNAATNTLSWVKTGGPLTADTYQVTLVSGSDAFVDALGNTLDGDGNFVAGDNYSQVFNKVVVGSTPIVSIPDFARAPGQAVDLTANNTLDTMLPVRATGVNVQGVNFELKYNPALLTINPLMVTPALAGWNVLANLSAPDVNGLVTLTVAAFASAPGFAFSGTQSVVSIAAAVPTTAPFGAAQVLRLQNAEVNDDDAQNDAAIQKVAFPGDANGSGILPGSIPPSAYTAFDSTLIARVFVGQDTGFDAYPLVDPAIVGDASGNGSLNAFDASLVLQEASGANTPEVPDETPTGTGGFDPFDPLLSIGDYYVNLNGPVTIPVNIKIETTVVGIISSTYVVKYDTSVLDFVDVQLGNEFPSPGWTLAATETSPGVIQVAMFATNPSSNFAGAVVELGKLNFEVVAADTGLVSVLEIDPVDPNESGLVWTKDNGSAISTFEADFDRDGDVDDNDLAAWKIGHGTLTGATVAQGDANRDGAVNGADFMVWQRQYGSVVTLPPATVHHAPASNAMATTELPLLSSQLEPASASAAELPLTLQPIVSFSTAAATDETPAQTIETLRRIASPLPSAAWWLASSTDDGASEPVDSVEQFDWDVAFDEWSSDSDSNGSTAVATLKRKASDVAEVEVEGAEDADQFEQEIDEAILSWLEG